MVLQRLIYRVTKSPFLSSLYQILKRTIKTMARIMVFLNELLMPTQHLRILYNHFRLLLVLVAGKLTWRLCFNDISGKIREVFQRYFVYTAAQNAKRDELTTKIEDATNYEEWKSHCDELVRPLTTTPHSLHHPRPNHPLTLSSISSPHRTTLRASRPGAIPPRQTSSTARACVDTRSCYAHSWLRATSTASCGICAAHLAGTAR